MVFSGLTGGKMNDILECPFCHMKGERITIKSRYRKGTVGRLMYWIECGYCGAFQPHDNLHGFRTPEKAIEKWNKVSAQHFREELKNEREQLAHKD